MLAETLNILHTPVSSLGREHISQLRDIINFHRHQYYELDSPLISDQEFDHLYSLLSTLEKKF
ncbi:hypothetical protein H6768_05460 [Candidatus Peribacteria bacterium]|nr:hypothetical protein [Candidatus Peribacteria bacterium]